MLALASAVTLSLAACGTQGAQPASTGSKPTSAASGDATTVGSFSFNSALYDGAKKAALDATGGKTDLGGSVDFVWGTGGAENDRLKALLQPFTDATGITVNVESVANIGQVVQTRLSAGNPPDVALDTGAGAVHGYFASGKLKPIDGIIPKDEFVKSFGEGQADALTIDGHIYGIPGASQGIEVWYNKKTYTGPTENVSYSDLVKWAEGEVKKGATAPFCTNLEQGPASAVNATVQLDNIIAQEKGADFLQKLATGAIKYTSPDVEKIYRDYVAQFGDGLVYGGAQGALTSPIKDSPLNMFTSPQKCQVTHWGSFVPGLITAAYPDLKPGTDFDYFPLKPEKSSQTPIFYTWGWETFAFSNSPQTKAFLKYWASTGFQSLTASTGAYVMANQNVDLQVYPNDLIRGIAKDMRDSDVRLGPYGIQPVPVRTTLLSAIMGSVADPSQLHEQLAKVDKAYATYKASGGK
ncbi:ABC transporter substrate-binding protein [Leifsonia sp. NPDC058194]|uniref:ABC transporter substrate-binding protein n=1 Tax=Leifsonia sp. NPDC058194 TaxID=3346374 RepID=UPI0036DCAD00